MRREVAAEDRATTAKDPKLRIWPLALGGVGFVCGFVGPIVLSPDANQGPLLGLLITGPIGVGLGLVTGLVARRLPLPPAARWELLGASCLLLAGLVLYAAMPEPKLAGEIIEAEVRRCTPPAAHIDDSIRDWTRRVADAPWAKVRPWEPEVKQMLASDPGVVLELHIVRKRGIYESQKPWNRGRLLAHPWQAGDETRPYFARFAGGSCDGYADPGRRLFYPTSEPSRLWPPDALPGILQLQVLRPVPEEYLRFSGPS